MSFMLLWNEVLDHEKAFNEYLHFVSIGDNGRAVESARNLLRGISETLARIQKEYPTLFIESKMPELPADREMFETRGASLALRDLSEVAGRLQSYLDGIGREVGRFRRYTPPKWKIVLNLYRAKVLWSLAIVGAAGLLWWAVHVVVTRGQGLAGEYYEDMDLGIFYRQRIDRRVDFSWGRGGPFPGWRRDRFSVRWNGFLRIPEKGQYEFYVHTDDGARFYLGEKMLIDDWHPMKLRVLKTSIQLEAGYHPIRLDYFERSKYATIKLYWKTVETPRPEPIPSNLLRPSERFLPKGAPVHRPQGPVGFEEEEETEVPEGDAPRSAKE